MSNLVNIPLENAYKSSLSGSIAAAAATCTVDDAVHFTLPAGQTVDIVIDPENSKRERRKITAISVDKKTFTLSAVQPDYLGHTPTSVPHSGGAKVVITDSWSIFDDIGTAVNSKVDKSTGAIQEYATEAARDLAITVPVNGMQVFITDTGKFTDYTAGAWVDRESGGTFANASTTVAGKVEEATLAQVVAKTGTGETGARMFIAPDNAAFIDDSAGAADAGKLPVTDANGRLKASMHHIDSQSLEDDGSDNLRVKLKTGGGIVKDANGLAAQAAALESTAYTYGEAISIKDLLYLKQSDNRLWKVTSDAKNWKTIVGVAMEAGNAGDAGKRVLLKGLVDTAFSAINPDFSSSGGAVQSQFGDAVNTRAKAWRLDNTAGPECVVNGVGTIRIKKTGTPAAAFCIGLCLGSATVPYVGWYTAQGRPYGMILAETSIAQLNIGNVYDDEEFTFTNVAIPANTYVWVVCWTQNAADAANYYWIENTATAGGATLVTSAATCQWTAANFLPNYSLTMSSVNPWEKHYAVRAYNGTAGGYGIGDNAATLPWNRVVGHVVSATQWYFNPSNNNIDSGTFIDSQDDTVPSWLDTSITDLGFRPSWIDFSICSLEAVVATKMYEGYSNYIANAALANSVQGYGISIDLLGVPAVPTTGTAFPSTSTVWAYYAIPFENGFYFSDTPRLTGAGTDPWPSANLLSLGVKYVASQK
jgi:hypothetical protein